jgi:hypothetical protein
MKTWRVRSQTGIAFPYSHGHAETIGRDHDRTVGNRRANVGDEGFTVAVRVRGRPVFRDAQRRDEREHGRRRDADNVTTNAREFQPLGRRSQRRRDRVRQNQVAVEVHVGSIDVRKGDAARGAGEQHAQRSAIDARERRNAAQGEQRHDQSVLRRGDVEPQLHRTERTPRVECANDRFARVFVEAEDLVEKTGFRARRVHVPVDVAAAADVQPGGRIEVMLRDVRRA